MGDLNSQIARSRSKDVLNLNRLYNANVVGITPKIDRFVATPAQVTQGGSALLSWVVQGATSIIVRSPRYTSVPWTSTRRPSCAAASSSAPNLPGATSK